MFKKIIYAIAFFTFLSYSIFAKAEEPYYPHPIIFVHGINSNSSTWAITKPEIKKYFYDKTTGECKYFTIANPYLSAIDYPDKGDIRTSALIELKNTIDDAVKGLPDDQKKVIIVAHSMGGLVTRTLLGLLTDYQNKVDKVVFIGTPHLGSPFASAVWLLDRIRSEIIYPALTDYPSFYSINAGSRFRFSDSSSFLTATGLPSQIYNDLSSSLQKEARLFDSALIFPDENGFTGSIALEQLRLNQDVSFQKTIESSLSGKKININLYGRIFGNDTFLGQANYLGYRQNFNVILCQDPSYYNVLAFLAPHLKYWNSKLLGIPNLLPLAIDNFSYPPDLSISDAVNTGDGIVPQASQGAIGGVVSSITSFHVGETDAWQPILKALDDPPVIESVRFVRFAPDLNASDYIIVKVKDYLLADIEILELTDADLTDFREPVTGKDKPYIGYPEKGFLIERDVTVPDYGKIHLMPGEFHAKLTKKVDYGAIYNIRMKNPAGREVACQVALPVQKDDGVWRYVSNGYPYGCQPYDPGNSYFQQFRQNAINIFFNSVTSYSYPDIPPPVNQPYFHTSPVGGSAYSVLTAWASSNEPPYYSWRMDANSDIAPSLTFNLAITKPVKSAKLIGNFQFENYRKKSITRYEYPEEIIEEIKDIDFNVSFDKDNVSFILNTKSGNAIDIPIDPQCLNPNGTNTWILSAEFLKDNALTANCFPDYYIEPPLPANTRWLYSTRIIYRQRAYIDNPLLIVNLEE